MCDTFVKRGEASFFGKNSDRSCNEPNLVMYFPAAKHFEPRLQATYITLPQVEYTNGVLLVKPSWMWGAEMGINDKGVCIGNEAVFTKSRSNKIQSLIGMDFLRLALERGENAKQCAQIIIDLLQEYGQGGNCGFDKRFYYCNSFLIADKGTSYILETNDKEYKLTETAKDANISNRLSITEDDFAGVHSDFLFTHFSQSKKRQRALSCALENVKGLEEAFDALRRHDAEDYKILFGRGSVSSVCMHQSFLGDHTTGSFVYQFGEPVFWVTGSSTPCLSVFKPVSLQNPYEPCFTDAKKAYSYWLTREKVLRALYCEKINLEQYKEKAQTLEKEFVRGYDRLDKKDANAVKAFCENCSKREVEFIASYAKEGEEILKAEDIPSSWKKRNAKLLKGDPFSPFLQRRVK